MHKKILKSVSVLMAVVLFLTAFCVLIIKLISEKNNDPRCRFGGGLGFLGATMAGMFDNVWYHFGVFCLFWIAAAISASCEKS